MFLPSVYICLPAFKINLDGLRVCSGLSFKIQLFVEALSSLVAGFFLLPVVLRLILQTLHRQWVSANKAMRQTNLGPSDFTMTTTLKNVIHLPIDFLEIFHMI
jgi:hypothetical protein